MKRESLYLQGGLALNSWYAETEATRNGRKQSWFARDAQSPSRTGVARETRALPGGRRRAREGGYRADKIVDAELMLGFVIDSIVVLSRASRHVDDAKIPNSWNSGQLFLLLGSGADPPRDHCCCRDWGCGCLAKRHAECLPLGLRRSSSLQRLPRWLRGGEQTRGRLCASRRSGANATRSGCARATGG
jgi:hypothetical protein